MRARLIVYICCCEHVQVLCCGQVVRRTAVLAVARGFGINIAFVGDPTTTLVGKLGVRALPENTSGTKIVSSKKERFSHHHFIHAAFCGFILLVPCVWA